MTDFFVRPTGGEYGDEDGSSYDNAWDGFSNIVWAGDGVDDGDTLYLCGTFNTDTTGGEGSLNPSGAGSSGSPITIRGDYPSYPGILEGGDNAGDDMIILATAENYFTFEGITFQSPSAPDITGLYLYKCSHIIVNNCTFLMDNTDCLGIKTYAHDGTSIHDILISNCNFDFGVTLGNAAIYFSLGDPNGKVGNHYDITVENNTFTNSRWGVKWFLHGVDAADKIAKLITATRPYNVKIQDNVFTDISTRPIEMGYGCAGEMSYIRRNTIIGTGTAAQANVNVINLHYCEDLIVEYNFIDGCRTSVPDGAGIIMDFCQVNSYICDGVIVRYNTITGCIDGKAMTVWLGKNCEFYYNICYGNKVGMVVNNVLSTGNLVYNNVFYDDTDYNVHVGYEDNGITTFKNNIFSTAQYNVRTQGSPADQIFINNCFHGAIVAKLTDVANCVVETDSINEDPLFIDADSNNFKLKSNSPCINKGTDVGLSEDYDGRTLRGLPDIGAYESLIKSFGSYEELWNEPAHKSVISDVGGGIIEN